MQPDETTPQNTPNATPDASSVYDIQRHIAGRIIEALKISQDHIRGIHTDTLQALLAISETAGTKIPLTPNKDTKYTNSIEPEQPSGPNEARDETGETIAPPEPPTESYDGIPPPAGARGPAPENPEHPTNSVVPGSLRDSRATRGPEEETMTPPEPPEEGDGTPPPPEEDMEKPINNDSAGSPEDGGTERYPPGFGELMRMEELPTPENPEHPTKRNIFIPSPSKGLGSNFVGSLKDGGIIAIPLGLLGFTATLPALGFVATASLAGRLVYRKIRYGKWVEKIGGTENPKSFGDIGKEVVSGIQTGIGATGRYFLSLGVKGKRPDQIIASSAAYGLATSGTILAYSLIAGSSAGLSIAMTAGLPAVAVPLYLTRIFYRKLKYGKMFGKIENKKGEKGHHHDPEPTRAHTEPAQPSEVSAHTTPH